MANQGRAIFVIDSELCGFLGLSAVRRGLAGVGTPRRRCGIFSERFGQRAASGRCAENLVFKARNTLITIGEVVKEGTREPKKRDIGTFAAIWVGLLRIVYQCADSADSWCNRA